MPTIDTMLRRPLKNGANFSPLMPYSSCEVSYLGKGDTYFSMDIIEEYIKKYTHHTKKLAPELQGKTLQQTVNNVYRFLYDHLQYKADLEDQMLRSPACSWAERNKGIDCKSYTIFAGTILRNLGIAFYIRKIRQSGDPKGEFSHVYVVVPKDQPKGKLHKGYFVIDGTVHRNNETPFLEKKDVFMSKMPHYGLKGATPSGLKGIPCNIQNFQRRNCNDFFDYLRNRGVSPRVVDSAQTFTLECFRNGFDPSFEFTPKEMKIAGVSYPLAAKGLGLNGEGDGIDPNTAEEIFQEVKKVSGIVGLYEGTIGAVLGNNWRLGCWGTSGSPAQAERETPQDYQAFLQSSNVRQQFNTANFNKFIEAVQIYIASRYAGKNNGDLAKCTRDGNNTGYIMMQAFQQEAVARATTILQAAGGNLVKKGAKTLTNWNIPTPSGYYNGSLKPIAVLPQVTVNTYEVINPTGATYTDPNSGTGAGSTAGSGAGTATGNTGGGFSAIDETPGSYNTPTTTETYYSLLSNLEKKIRNVWLQNNKNNNVIERERKAAGIKLFSRNFYLAVGQTPPYGVTNQTQFNTIGGGDTTKLGGGSMILLLGVALGTWYYGKKKNTKKTKKDA